MPETNGQPPPKSISLRPFLALVIYLIGASCWITITDRLLSLITRDPDLLATLEMVKGLVFVGVSGALLYLCLARVARTNLKLEEMVSERTAALLASEHELRKSEGEQRRQREFLECLIAHAGAAIAVVEGNELRYTLANPVFQEFAGGVPMVGRTYREVFPEAAEAGAEALVRQVLETGQPWKVDEYRAPVPGKPDATWDGQVVRLPLVEGRKPAAMVFAWDVTARRRIEEKIRESEERFRSLVEGAPEGIYIEVDTKYRYLNPVALEMLGADTADQLIGHSIVERLHPDCRDAAINGIQNLTEHNEVALTEGKFLRLDGSTFDAEVAAVRSVFDGKPSVVVFFRDITERKQTQEKMQALEAQLRHSQKMEAIGRLAGGIAHHFNNLLTIIGCYAEIVGARLSSDEVVQNKLQAIKYATERGASLTRQMLAFSRKQTLFPVVIDPTTLVHEAAKMVRPLLSENIELCVSTGIPLWHVEADVDQIVQVLMNLCVNALDAMPNGGRLEIAARNVTVPSATVSVPEYLFAGDYVALSVTDTGTGIPMEAQQHIFDPFFTTKEVGKGAGLGLAMVYGVVEQSNGYVWADSAPDRGSSFHVYLPKTTKAISKGAAGNGESRATQETSHRRRAEDRI